jgi:hypothetical protein
MNLSRPDIMPADFAGDLPLVIDPKAEIIDVLNRDALQLEWPHLSLSAKGSKLSIAPALISSRRRIPMDLLTEGSVVLTHDSQLGNVRLVPVPSDPDGGDPLNRQAAHLATILIVLVVAGTWIAAVQHASPNVLRIAGGIAIASFLVLVRIVPATWRMLGGRRGDEAGQQGPAVPKRPA